MTDGVRQDPVAYPQVGLTGPAAGLIADLNSISRDLYFAGVAASRYADAAADDDVSADDQVIRQALWNAAAISYRRAFGTGRGLIAEKGSRVRLDDRFVATLSEDHRLVHRQVLEMANQHVAHRVGEHEGAAVVAVLALPPADREIVAVGTLSVHMVGPTPEVAAGLSEICTRFM